MDQSLAETRPVAYTVIVSAIIAMSIPDIRYTLFSGVWFDPAIFFVLRFLKYAIQKLKGA